MPILEPAIFILGIIPALALAKYGFKLMNTPTHRRPRIMRQWPKPSARDTDTADLVPPSQRKSSELRPPTVLEFSNGG